MNKQNKLRWLTLAAAATLVAATTGCHNANTSEKLHGEAFESDDAPRSSRNARNRRRMRSSSPANSARELATTARDLRP